MKNELINLFLFIGVCFMFYLLFRNFNFTEVKEGMTTASGITAPENGVAGNAAGYGAGIKAANIKFQDTFLISKYRSDYETVILDLDDYINNKMLEISLNLPLDNADGSREKIKILGDLNNAKLALNNVMKFIDKK